MSAPVSKEASAASVLFITLDLCRFDTFVAANAVALKEVAPLHKAHAPSHFTYGSHAAMFIGFTPGVVAAQPARFLNPKFARLFRLARAGFAGYAEPGFAIDGRDIVHGFRNAGYSTIGTGAMGWFDPASSVSEGLISGFDDFFFAGRAGVKHQVHWVEETLARHAGRDSFVFINVGETHVPYHFIGASWDSSDNPCVPFQVVDRRDECSERQRLCCEYADRALGPLLSRFRNATTIVCADHGDCWGEDGLWEHGVSHPMTLTVPLLIRYKGVPVGGDIS